MHYHAETIALIWLIKRLYETYSRDLVYISCHRILCHFATGTFASKYRHFSNNTFILYKYLFRTSCNNTSSVNKSRSYLHIIVSCCGLEFQFLSVPTHSRLPTPSTVPHSTFPTHHHLWDTTVRTTQYILSVSVIKTSQLMLYWEIIAVCSQIHTKYRNTMSGQKVELLNVKLVVHIVTTGL